jgi:hypothetical protein
MHAMAQLAGERARDCLELAERQRHGRQQHALRRARRKEQTAERCLIKAWHRAAELRARLEPNGY